MHFANINVQSNISIIIMFAVRKQIPLDVGSALDQTVVPPFYILNHFPFEHASQELWDNRLMKQTEE